MKKNECLTEAWQAVEKFWAVVPPIHFAHPGSDALSFSMTEFAEAESRWLRLTNPQYRQNSDKGRDEETVMSELGDTLYMLITYAQWCGFALPEIVYIPQIRVYTDWFDELANLFGTARRYRATQSSLCNLVVIEILAEILSYPNFDCFQWVKYTLDKIAHKHGLEAWYENELE